MISVGSWSIIGHAVTVVLDSGKPKKRAAVSGYLIGRDPVDLGLILIKDNMETLELVPGPSVKKLKEVDIEDVDPNVLNITLKKISGSSHDIEADSESIIRERCLKIINYLASHHLEVEKKTENLYVIAGAVKFERPFRLNNFYCDIPIVLKRILKLVEAIDN
ncbi:unnamed protein product [Caenorhabditis sp. 36 PRJEB53466]|nr:unnamed protein product [Caenorhabditis sp. 36 PRJEB53466]